MHEIKLIENLILVLNKEVESSEVGDVKSVHVDIGSLRHTTVEILETAFRHAPKHKKLASAELKVSVVPGVEFVVKSIEWN